MISFFGGAGKRLRKCNEGNMFSFFIRAPKAIYSKNMKDIFVKPNLEIKKNINNKYILLIYLL